MVPKLILHQLGYPSPPSPATPQWKNLMDSIFIKGKILYLLETELWLLAKNFSLQWLYRKSFKQSSIFLKSKLSMKNYPILQQKIGTTNQRNYCSSDRSYLFVLSSKSIEEEKAILQLWGSVGVKLSTNYMRGKTY